MPPLNSQQKKLIFDRWHNAIYAFSAIFTIAFFTLGITLIFLLLTGKLQFSALSHTSHKWLALAVLIVTVVPVILFINRILNIVKPICEGVKVSQTTFSEIDKIVKKYAKELAITPPQVYVAGGNRPKGSSHSFSKWKIIILHTDLVEAKGTFPKYNVLQFELARQMGLLALGERNFSVEFLSMVPSAMPYISTLLKRAEEYTADRVACLLAAESAAMYFSFCAVGKGIWPQVKVKSILEQAGKAGSSESVCAYFTTATPIPWRVLAIAKIGALTPATIQKWRHEKNIATRFSTLKYQCYGPFMARPHLIDTQTLQECDQRTNAEIIQNQL